MENESEKKILNTKAKIVALTNNSSNIDIEDKGMY